MKDRRQKQYPLFKNLWDRRIPGSDPRKRTSHFIGFWKMPFSVFLRRTKEKFLRWYNT